MNKLNALLFSNKAKVEMLADMVELLGEGMSVREIAEDFEKYGKGAIKEIGQSMQRAVGDGRSVSSAFEGYFNDITVQTIYAGENNQDLKGGFVNAQQAITNTGGVLGVLIKSISGPLIQLAAISVIVVGLSGQIFPILGELVPSYMWAGISKNFYAFATFIGDSALRIVGGMFLFFYLLGLFMKHYAGPGREFFDKLPGFTQYRYIVAAQVMYTMASVLRAGGSLYDSLIYAGDGVGGYQKSKVGESKTLLEQAQSASVGDLLDIELLSERELNRLKVMASSQRGNAERLQRCAEAHSELMLSQIDVLAKFLKTFTMAASVFMLLGMMGAILMLVMQARSAIV